MLFTKQKQFKRHCNFQAMLTGQWIHSVVNLGKNHYIVAMILYTLYTPCIQLIYGLVQCPWNRFVMYITSYGCPLSKLGRRGPIFGKNNLRCRSYPLGLPHNLHSFDNKYAKYRLCKKHFDFPDRLLAVLPFSGGQMHTGGILGTSLVGRKSPNPPPNVKYFEAVSRQNFYLKPLKSLEGSRYVLLMRVYLKIQVYNHKR